MKAIQTTLLALVGITAVTEMGKIGAWAAAEPDRWSQLVADYNEANPDQLDTPDYYEMGVYEKAKT